MTTDTSTDLSNNLLPVYNYLPVVPEKGEGLYLYTSDGDRYLDFYGGHAVALLGYNHPRLVSTLAQQAEKLFFQSNIVSIEVREKAAADLIDFSGLENRKVFFVNSGAEANENALRVACRATGRSKVVAVKGGFHGRTAAVAAATSSSGPWYGFPSTPFEPAFVDIDDSEGVHETVDDDTAAIILEPVMGMAGAVALSDDFLRATRAAADKHGAVLIFDEVQCGMGRTGFPFAANKANVRPDILTVAKGIAGGFPAAAAIISDHLTGELGKGHLGTTFGGAPMASAMISTVVDVIREEHLLDNVKDGFEYMKDRCVVGPVTEVTGSGYLAGLRTTSPAKEVLQGLMSQGILAGLSKDPNIVRLLPPLTLGRTEIDILAGALERMPV